MNKGLAILAVALVLLPVIALARMSSLEEEDMADVQGQVGISIDLTWRLNNSYLAWTDSDGYDDAAINSENQGALTFAALRITDGTSTGLLQFEGITLDTGSTGSTSYLCLGLPDMSGEIQFGEILIGTAAQRGGGPSRDGSLGRVFIGDLELQDSSITVSPY